MEAVNQLQQQYVDFLSSLYRGGQLDKQFKNIKELEDEPHYLNEILAIYFEDSEMHLHKLTIYLDQSDVDHEKVDYSALQLYENNLGVGTQSVKNICVTFRSCHDAKNLEGCLRCLQQLKDEYYLVKSKFQTLLTLEQQIIAAGGSIPVVEYSMPTQKSSFRCIKTVHG